MNKYFWNINQVKQNSNEIMALMNKAKTKEELAFLKMHLTDYRLMLQHYYKFIVEDVRFEEEFGAAENPSAIRKEAMNFKRLYPFSFREMCTSIIYELDEDINYEELKLKKINIDDDSYVNLMKQFLRDLDSEIYELMLPILNPKKGKLHITHGFPYSASCFTDTYKNQPYIHLRDDGTATNLINFPHEMGHATEFLLNIDDYRGCSAMVKSLSEVSSSWLELLFADWMHKKGYHVNQMALAQIERLNSWFCSVASVNDVLDIALLSVNYNRKHLKHIYQDFAIDKGAHLDMTYFMSFPIALQLRQQYKEDRSYGIYNAKRFMKSNKLDNFDEILEEVEVSTLESAKHVNNYTKELKLL